MEGEGFDDVPVPCAANVGVALCTETIVAIESFGAKLATSD